MNILFLADLMPGMFLIPSDSLSILRIFSYIFVLFLSLMRFLNCLLNSFRRCLKNDFDLTKVVVSCCELNYFVFPD